MLPYLKTLGNVLFKPFRVSQPPIHIQLEHTTYCNLNCKTCCRSKFVTKPKYLGVENFQRILKQIHPKKISLSGLGESFINPNIIKMIRLAKEHGCSINTTTNGTLLTPEICDQIVKSGLDLIKISIDGATRETYHRIRGEDKFLHVLDGIRSLTEAKKRLGTARPFVRLNYVMFKDNYHEIAKTVELVDKLGVDAIYFQPLDLVDIEERQALLVGDLTYAEFSQEITHALEVSRQASVGTNLEVIRKEFPTYWKKYQLETRRTDTRICILPWFSTFITVEGNLLPCCAFAQPNPNMGNILQADINEIWNGQKYQSFRKAIREGKRPYPMCENCVPPTLGDLAKSSKILPGFLK